MAGTTDIADIFEDISNEIKAVSDLAFGAWVEFLKTHPELLKVMLKKN